MLSFRFLMTEEVRLFRLLDRVSDESTSEALAVPELLGHHSYILMEHTLNQNGWNQNTWAKSNIAPIGSIRPVDKVGDCILHLVDRRFIFVIIFIILEGIPFERLFCSSIAFKNKENILHVKPGKKQDRRSHELKDLNGFSMSILGI
ncbi:hypothetical protein C5167_050737 [Papaver somniferum]|uniref:Uncharacterized protein n=1 Tax=Papaver somniferum TaxID=3469 RepID=A0A4Y7KPG6_PAPSO|nr:hypothetical protein C5167_050737 [Papaver somniferum]